MKNSCSIPPRSPYGLIQEDLWPSEFKILVACMLLNCTTRKMMERVFPTLIAKYPDAQSMANADHSELSQIISRLGFGNRRAKSLINMSRAYLKKDWRHVSELPGIGAYASAAWEIFIKNELPSTCPKDGALSAYYKWRKISFS